MSDRQDFIALEWVAGEIEETLKQASQALNAYIANRDDETQLRFCLTHIHQVHGTLQMVEFFGAALLAEEMEGLAHALSQGTVHDSHVDDALSVLNNAITQLPLYLKNVKEFRHGLPSSLLPVLNDLRAIRGESLLSETALFAPHIASPAGDRMAEFPMEGSELAEVVHKLRQMYQIALLGFIRGKEVRKNLNYLAKVCARLVKLSQGAPSQPLWNVCIAVLEGLLNGSIEPSVAVKILLRQIDRQIKAIVDEGEVALIEPAPEALLKNLLYYVARSKANSKFIKSVKAEFNLESSLLGEGDLEEIDALAAPDNNSMRLVVEALTQEINNILNAIDAAQLNSSKLTEVLPLFRRVTDTMAVLGLGQALKLIQSPFDHLAKVLVVQDSVGEEEIASIKSSLNEALAQLNPEVLVPEQAEEELFNDSEEAQQHLDEAFDSVVKESRNGLEQTKEAIIEFVATQWNHSCLQDVPALLREIYGSLNMIPLASATRVLISCERYVAESLLANKDVPEWQMLDTLADAITSIDYYLERLADDPDAEVDAIIQVAEESVAELGYPVNGGSSSEYTEESSEGSEVNDLEEDVDIPTITESVNDELGAPEENEESPESDATTSESIELESTSAVDDIPVLAEVIPIQSAADKAADESADQNINEEESSDEVVDLTSLSDDSNRSASAEQSGTTAGDEEEEYDPEIVEIFIEEAGEVLDTINEFLPVWIENANNDEARTEVRRAFHTLKGSGRMVGATDIGELAWSIENMLNRVLDGSYEMDQARFDIVGEVVARVPAMVTAFEQRQPVDKNELQTYIDRAEALAKAQSPAAAGSEEESLDGGESTESSNVVADSSVTDDDTTDFELIEIFAAEAMVHGEALDNYVNYCQELAAPAELTDDLQRALHTLKGSANMAGITPVAKVVTALESLVKELRASNLKADLPVVEALKMGSLFIKAGIDQLSTSPMEMLPGTQDYIEQIEQLLKERLSVAGVEQGDEGSIPPEALNQFLALSLDRVNEIAERLQRCQQAPINLEDIEQIERRLEEFVDHAESVSLLPLIEIGQPLSALYRSVADARAENLKPEFFDLCFRANDSIIDMLDQVAGQQTPQFDATLLAEIEEFELPGGEGESIDIPVLVDTADFADDDGDDITVVLDADELENTLQMAAVKDEDGIESSFIDALANDEELADTDAVDVDLEQIAETVSNFTAVNEADLLDATSPELADESDDSEVVATESEEIATEAMNDFVEAIAESELDNDIVDTDEGVVEELIEIAAAPVDEPADVDQITEAAPILTEPVAEPEPQFSVDDDDIDDEIIEIFLEEADDLLEGIDEAIHGWSDDRSNRIYLDDLLRILHTLKGGARLAGLTELGNLSHNFETSLIGLDGDDVTIGDDTLESIQRYQDQLIIQVNAIKNGETVQPTTADDVAPVVDPVPEDTVSAADSEQGFVLDVPAKEEAREPEVIPFPSPVEPAAAVVPFTAKKGGDGGSKSVDTAAEASAKKGPQEVVKVSAQLLENLVNLAGETSISRGRAEEQISELVFSLDEMQITVDRLQEQVRRLDMETEAQILYRQEQVESEGMEGFDPLEMDRYSQLQQLSRSLLESSSDLIDIKNTLGDKSRDMETLLVQQSRINTELQEGLMRSRMVPFARMVPRLRRIVRQVSVELDKKVDLYLDNVEGELDRTVLEKMVAPLEHMIRNAVDHGIESQSEREAAGKPPAGRIRLGLQREGGEIVINLSDDGSGIDLEAVRDKAIERGLMEADADLTDHEILQFILQAGFSTATEVTQISGRGVGMDVVYSEIKQLGGSMDINSQPGQGSHFIIRLPFTVSVNRALMVNIAGDRYAIPLNTIEGIVRVSPFELEAYYQPNAPMFEYAGQPYLLRYMGALLQRGEKPNLEGQSMPLPVVLVRGAEHSVAIQVDSLMGSREIVVKPLGPQFSMVQGLSGATVMGDGSVVVILDLLAMIRADASHMHRDFIAAQDNAPADSRAINVMVVDDSVTVRKVTSRFLERQGMEVVLAKDGVDAITQLQEIERVPDVMLLDIEMPRMDGFEVASRIRHNSRLKDIPIIMITSRTGDKHRERALSLGVNEYMGKPYQESLLLETINSLVGAEVN